MNNPWIFPIIGFITGSIPFGLMMAKFKDIDLRTQGSGNIGATNVWRVMGKKFGFTCLMLDALKGFIPVYLCIKFFPVTGDADRLTLQTAHVITALAAILGHNFSPFAGFKGGKGIATSAGVLIALMPFGALLLFIIFGIALYLTKMVSLASIIAAISLPLLTIYGSWHHGKIQNGTWNKALFLFTLIAAIMAIWKHRSNITRIINGTENKIGSRKKEDEK